MNINELDFEFPENLIGTEPQNPPRVMWVEGSGEPSEITIQELLQKFSHGDVVVLNSTKVLKRRVFTKSSKGDDLEILFLNQVSTLEWEVLFPSRDFKIGDIIDLPLGHKMTLIQKGRPQKIRTEKVLTEDDFEKMAEIPLPPYIQRARGERHSRSQDQSWYQTDWAEKPGSLAAPTASLHFKKSDLEILKSKGVHVVHLVLHVGLGTFLPVTVSNLDEHEMHSEYIEISKATWETILEARKTKHKIWALGTTVARSLESAAMGIVEQNDHGFFGYTKLLIQPGFQWKIVDRLLTNFHQPKSTLLALVYAFVGAERAKSSYRWAIARKFRLFSYGDLSVWIRD